MKELLTKEQWEVRFKDFCERYTWLSYKKNFARAPGWLDVIDQCLSDIEEVIEPVGLDKVTFFGLHVNDGHVRELGVYGSYSPEIGEARENLCKDIVRHAVAKLNGVCCKCGEVYVDNAGFFGRTPQDACEAHASFEGVFEEDLLASQADLPEALDEPVESEAQEDVAADEECDMEMTDVDSAELDADDDIDHIQAKLYDMDELRALTTDKSNDRNVNQRRKETVRKMQELGEMRDYCAVPDATEMAHSLRSAFPNFAEVVDFIECYVTLARSNGKLRLPPMLLEGPAGIGKTAFTSALARSLDTGYIEVHMENEQTNATLAGSAEFWGNSQCGVLFDTLVFGRTCNPLVVVDEVDKALRRPDFNPLNALYQLLERDTAKQFRDLGFRGVALDASNVMWIMTANDASSIDPPILSRLRRFMIEPPTQEQSGTIAKRIYEKVLERNEWSGLFEAELADETAQKLADLAPRVMQSEIEAALGRVARDGRRSILAGDVGMGEKQSQRGIGFVWNDGRQA